MEKARAEGEQAVSRAQAETKKDVEAMKAVAARREEEAVSAVISEVTG